MYVYMSTNFNYLKKKKKKSLKYTGLIEKKPTFLET